MNTENNNQIDSDYTPDSPQQSRRSAVVQLRTLQDLDGRTRAAKAAQRLVHSMKRDLGGELSSAQRELVQRAALLGAMLEDAETRWLESKPADLASYGQLVDRQRRLLETLGLKRQAPIVADDQLARLIDLVTTGDK